MRIGVNKTFPHDSPEQWAKHLHDKGYRASRFPVSWRTDLRKVDEYLAAAREYDIMIAEVGVWNSPHSTDPAAAAAAVRDLKDALGFADYVGARCCVNISGAAGPVWNLCYKENYSPKLYEKNVRLVQTLLDDIRPKKTYFTFEPMQWMLPDSPQQYLQFVRDVDRERFAVHMDATNFLYSPKTFLDFERIVDESFDLLGPMIRSCHIKDCRLDEERYSFCVYEVPCGDGVLNFGHYLDRIEALDPDMPALFEHLKEEEEFDRCFAHVRAIRPDYVKK